MLEKLNSIILEEIELVLKLLSFLEEQHSFIVNDDVFGLEGIVSRIEGCSKEIARIEVQRREITSGRPIRNIISELKNSELDTNFRKMRRLLEETRLQKDTNGILIRQGLSFTTRMLSILSPDRTKKTYNNYGKMTNR
jgi:flagellar biosynthesis/type III secretory pathway chaperone